MMAAVGAQLGFTSPRPAPDDTPQPQTTIRTRVVPGGPLPQINGQIPATDAVATDSMALPSSSTVKKFPEQSIAEKIVHASKIMEGRTKMTRLTRASRNNPLMNGELGLNTVTFKRQVPVVARDAFPFFVGVIFSLFSQLKRDLLKDAFDKWILVMDNIDEICLDEDSNEVNEELKQQIVDEISDVVALFAENTGGFTVHFHAVMLSMKKNYDITSGYKHKIESFFIAVDNAIEKVHANYMLIQNSRENADAVVSLSRRRM